MLPAAVGRSVYSLDFGRMFSALTKRKRQSKVSVGQRYQKRDAPLVVWEVVSLFKGTDGMPYAAMLRVDDPTMQKTVAQAILERGLHYTPVGRQ